MSAHQPSTSWDSAGSMRCKFIKSFSFHQVPFLMGVGKISLYLRLNDNRMKLIELNILKIAILYENNKVNRILYSAQFLLIGSMLKVMLFFPWISIENL